MTCGSIKIYFKLKVTLDYSVFIIPPAFMPTGIYFSSFCSSIRLFVCSLVRSFVLSSRSWNLRQSFALKLSMPVGGARGQNLEHLKKCFI